MSFNASVTAAPWRVALQLGQLAVHGLQMSLVSAGTVLASRDMGWRRPMELLAAWQARQIRLGGIAASNVLAASVDAGRWREVLSCVIAGKARGVRNVAMETQSLGAFAATGDWQRSLDVVSTAGERDLVMLNAFLTCCARVARWQEALLMITEIAAWSLRASVVTFNVALLALASAQQWIQGLQLLQLMPLQPDSLTLNTLMLVYSEAGLWREALALLGAFAAWSCEPTVVSFGTAVTACPAVQWPRSLALATAAQAAGHTVRHSAVTPLGRAARWRMALQMAAGGGAEAYSSAMLACLTAIEGRGRAQRDLMGDMLGL